jgi:HlyD family secretion protein
VKRYAIVGAGILILAAIIFASVRGSGPKGVEVYLEPVKARDIKSLVSAPGQIDPKLKVNISAHVIGKIDRLYFREGDHVKKGTRLVDLEKVAFVAARDRLAAELQNRRIEVRRAQLSLANADLQYRRATKMREQGIQAEEPFERARLEYDTARENVASAQEGVRQSAAALAQAQDDLTRTSIMAPFDGKIVELNAHEGEVVITGTMNNPGSVIAVLADLSEILVEAEVTETEVVRVKPGQSVTIKVDAVPDHEYEGTVSEIGSSATVRASAAASGVRYFKVKIAIANPDERLRPGMTAQVDIVAEAVRGVLAVPVQSVVERDPKRLDEAPKPGEDDDVEKKKYVFVHVDGKVKMHEVQTGISDATHVAVTSGLNGKESIVTGPFRTIKKLKDGDRVKPAEEKKKPGDAKDDEKTSEEK